jgi:hypothetical protein
MTLEHLLHRTTVHLTAGWRPFVLKRALWRLVLVSLLAGPAVSSTASAQVQPAPPIAGVIGTVQSSSGSSLDLQTPSGVVHVGVKQPLTTYKQVASDLSRVMSTSYVGVAPVAEADGKEVAKQIIIFPAELRGATEGSVLTDPPGATTHSRMTNGSVCQPASSLPTPVARPRIDAIDTTGARLRRTSISGTGCKPVGPGGSLVVPSSLATKS